ncbi:MAG: hypothetical protein IPM51_07085 [Sphingobacteriaceae bacterium]|nr:hypothetical protein [Sphingobacteriaceae bacterium]
MIKINVLVILIIFFCSNIIAQQPGFTWAENSGYNSIMANDHGYAVRSDASGNIYVAGTFSGSADFDPGPAIVELSTSTASANIFLVKYNSSGACLWARSIGSFSSTEGVNDLAIDGSGNVIIVGNFNTVCDFDPSIAEFTVASNGSGDAFFAKYDANGNFIFVRTIGGLSVEDAKSVQLDPSGTIYLTGNFTGTVDFDPSPGIANLTSVGSWEIFIAKYDASGNYISAGSIGGTGLDYPLSLKIDAAGNSFVTGAFSGNCDFDPGPGSASLTSAGNTDIFVAKYNSTGNYVWAIRLGGTGSDQGKSVQVDATGNVYVSGFFNGTGDFDPGPGVVNLVSAGGEDAFFAKYNSSGTFMFANRMGSTFTDRANSLVLDATGNIYLTGTFQGTVDFNPAAPVATLSSNGTTQDIFIAKYSNSGVYTFAFRAGFNNADNGNNISLDPSENIIVTGNFYGTVDFDPGPFNNSKIANFQSSFFVGKYTSAGAYVFAVASDDSGGGVGANAITTDASGNVYVAGTCSYIKDLDPGPGIYTVSPGVYVQKLNSAGNLIWARSAANTNCYPSAIAVDSNGDICVLGVFTSSGDFDPGPGVLTLTSAGSQDAYIFKWDASGNLVWAKSFGNIANEYTGDMKIDASGNICYTGWFSGTTDLDPGPGVLMFTTFGVEDYYVTKLNSAGVLIFAYRFGTSMGDEGHGLCLDATGNIYTTGTFRGTMDFDPGPGVYNLTPAGQNDIFIHKLSPTGTFLMARRMGGTGGLEVGYSISLDPTGNILSTGMYSTTCDFDPGPGTFNMTGSGFYDVYISKLDPAGNFLWAKKIGSNMEEWVNTIGCTPSGNVIVQGRFNSPTVDFDPGPGSYINASNGSFDIYLNALDASGNFLWNRVIGGPNIDGCNNGHVDANGNIYSVGYFTALSNSVSIDFDPTPSVYNLTAAAGDFYAFEWELCSLLSPPGAIAGNTLVCGGSTNSYSVAPILGANSYSWNLPGGWTGTSTTNIISITVNGTSGVISVNGINNCGSSSTSTLAVNINSIPVAPSAIAGPNPICIGSTGVYSIAAVPGATSYSWTLPVGWSGSSITTSISAVSGNSGSITVMAINACGSSSATVLNVTVNTIPIVSISGGTNSICAFDNLVLTANGASTYSWSTGALTPTISISPSITTNFSVLGTTGACTGSSAITITVNPLPNITINGSASVCLGGSVSLTGGGGITYTWSTGSNATVIAVSPTVNSTYTLSGTNGNNCSNNATFAVNVNAAPAAPLSIAGLTTFCTGLPSLSYSVNPVIGATSYSWSLPVGWSGNSITNSIAAVPGQNGGIISIFASNICGSSPVQTLAVTVNPLPTVSVNALPINVCSGASSTLNAGGALSYSWSNGGLSSTTVVNPIATTIYSVIGTNSFSCTSTSTIVVGVFNNPTLSVVSSTNLLCLGQSATITASGALSYTWNTGANASTVIVTPSLTTNYTITGADINNCSAFTIFTQSVTVCQGLSFNSEEKSK